jgi:hypothetical protein
MDSQQPVENAFAFLDVLLINSKTSDLPNNLGKLSMLNIFPA